jgi:ring-1,2-phenylacetyl-CoA epoxidase subunit PaaB
MPHPWHNSIQVQKGSCQQLYLSPDRSESFGRRTKISSQVCQGTTVFRQLIVYPLPDIIRQHQQLVAVVLGIILRKQIEGQQEFNVFHSPTFKVSRYNGVKTQRSRGWFGFVFLKKYVKKRLLNRLQSLYIENIIANAPVNSLDPRVKRLPKLGQPGIIEAKAPLDQFGTYEVFVQPREGKPFQHEGIVHAPNLEMAFILAKETFTRRFTCASLCVTDTRHVFVSPMSEDDRTAYDLLPDPAADTGLSESFEIYHLLKRGKQHIHATTVRASNALHAMTRARDQFAGKLIMNVWAIRSSDIRFTTPEEKDLWQTLPEKKFRDATEYKGGDKLKSFLDRSQT